MFLKKGISKAVILVLGFLSFSSHANENITSTIDFLSVYTDYGNGDAAFATKEKGTICYGYWVSGDAPGFDQVYGSLLSAWYAKAAVELTVSFSESTKWSASSNHYCKVVRVALSDN